MGIAYLNQSNTHVIGTNVRLRSTVYTYMYVVIDYRIAGFFSRAINFTNFANDNHFTKINSSNFINFR